MTTFTRTPRYKTAINELVDAIADMPIDELASSSVYWGILVRADLHGALEKRHRKFNEALSDAVSKIDRQQREAERRRAGARKAALTRAARHAATR
jgi:hypothetical protein